MKTTTLQKLQQVYTISKWQFFSLNYVLKWGATIEELDQLEEDGHIIRRSGIGSTVTTKLAPD